jgi:hypothetical protein
VVRSWAGGMISAGGWSGGGGGGGVVSTCVEGCGGGVIGA